MLAYYVEWHMRRALAPMLFDDDDRDAARARRPSVVAPAERSARAQQKALSERTDDGTPVHSFQTLLQDLATVAKNRIQPRTPPRPPSMSSPDPRCFSSAPSTFSESRCARSH
jgi:hypothetical protein